MQKIVRLDHLGISVEMKFLSKKKNEINVSINWLESQQPDVESKWNIFLCEHCTKIKASYKN